MSVTVCHCHCHVWLPKRLFVMLSKPIANRSNAKPIGQMLKMLILGTVQTIMAIYGVLTNQGYLPLTENKIPSCNIN